MSTMPTGNGGDDAVTTSAGEESILGKYYFDFSNCLYSVVITYLFVN